MTSRCLVIPGPENRWQQIRSIEKAANVALRPFQVLDATRFADALTATISDPLLGELPPVGAIDQYVDSTDLTDHNHADRGNRYIAGPTVSQ
jgi:hypothetical protein